MRRRRGHRLAQTAHGCTVSGKVVPLRKPQPASRRACGAVAPIAPEGSPPCRRQDSISRRPALVSVAVPVASS
jgi:hypothetical protein